MTSAKTDATVVLAHDAWESTLADNDRGLDAGRAVRVYGDAKFTQETRLEVGFRTDRRQLFHNSVKEDLPVIWEPFAEEDLALSVGQAVPTPGLVFVSSLILFFELLGNPSSPQ